jgi:tetratricopeptide (TPR) repeat protein
VCDIYLRGPWAHTGPVNTHPKIAQTLSLAVLWTGLVLFVGCGPYSQSGYLERFDSDIRKAGAAIESARTDAQRAAAYADRGATYSEKARYSRVQKLITIEEYNKLFELSIADFSKAIALDSGNTDLYYRRGYVYYGRAGAEMIYDRTPSPALVPAKADFSIVVARNPKNAQAWDMLGLTDASLGEWTAAISDFTQETALDSKARYRVSDAYCNRGSAYLTDKKYDLAASDFTRAIEMGNHADPCECDPYNQLMWIYLTQTHESDKAQALAAKARAAGRWIAPDNVDQLKAAKPSR